jgi:hypothetical protein
MINIILLILFLLLFFITRNETFYNVDFNDDIYKEENLEKTLLNNYKIENDFNCYIYGCNTSRNDMIEWIGMDENKNEIFTNKKNYYIFNNGFLNKTDNIDNNKIVKYDSSITIPTIINNDKLQLKINLKYKDYSFCGYLTNNYYNLQYLLYYKNNNVTIENDSLYEYIAIKIIDKEYKVIHKLPLIKKIDNLETIWINYGPILLGPFIYTTQL